MTTKCLPRSWRPSPTLGSTLVLISMAALATTAPLTANAADAALSWASLDRQQQAALAPLASDWASLDVVRRSKWVDIAARLSVHHTTIYKELQRGATGALDANQREGYSAELAERRLRESFKRRGKRAPAAQ